MQVEVASVTGLLQINAPTNALAAYRFYGRPFALTTKLKRIEPVLNVADRLTMRLEETRLLAAHALSLRVEKAGIYAVELQPQAGFTVADARGEGVDDWKVIDGKLRVSFAARVLGARQLDVQLEQPLKQFPDQIVLAPLRVANAAKETAEIGAASVLGIRIKTAELVGLREVPVTRLSRRTDESLAYTADQPDWKLALTTERLAARMVADIFNLVTIGDGLVGGSATIRFGIVNQGVQEFRVRVPNHWKNLEFTGPNIRRKEQQTNEWIIGLQDKAWGGYTLVITYDFSFDPKGASLSVGGAHVLNAERETGSIAITTAPGSELKVKTAADPLRRIDDTELSSTDRALIARPVLLAYRYTGDRYDLTVEVTRFDQLPVLDAIADRTQLTTVLTEEGQMLTQASFMVKNNAKQYQWFQLPKGGEFWSCYVNGQPVKAEKDAGGLLIPLPRGSNRDQAIAVDLVYAQTTKVLGSWLPRSIELVAPQTDVPNTYAEWELYVPKTHRMTAFGGNMTVARGEIYGWRDAWQRFAQFYSDVWREAGAGLMVFGGLILFAIAVVVGARRRGWGGVVAVLAVCCLLLILAGMMLPTLSRAKAKSQRIVAANNLKQLGLALHVFSNDNADRLPGALEEMRDKLSSEHILVDPESGQQFVYVRGAEKLGDLSPDSVLAYSPVDNNGRHVLFADGSVQRLSSARFDELERRGFPRLAQAQEQVLEPAVAQAPQQQGRQPLHTLPPQMARRYGLSSETRPAEPARAPTATDRVGVERLGGSGGVPAPPAAPAMAQPAAPVPAAPPPTQPPPMAREELAAQAVTAPAAATAPVAAGVRPLRIEIPRTGYALNFTKVLNVRGEPLTVRARITQLKAISSVRMVLQVAALLAGLILMWLAWRRPPRSSFKVTLGATLILGSVASMLIGWGLLHWVMIIAAPLLALAILIWVVCKLWPRRPKIPPPLPGPAAPPVPGPSDSGPANAPPVMAAIALAFCSMLAQAAESGTALPGPSALNPSSLAPHTSSFVSNAVSLLSATYTGTVGERVAQMDVVIVMSSIQTNQIVRLFSDDVAIQQFTATPTNVILLREGASVSARLSARGEATLQLKCLVKLGGTAAQRQLSFGIPSTLFSQLTLTLEEPDAEVEFPSAVAFKRVSQAQHTRVEAVIGLGERVDLRWTPRVKRAAEIAATVFCQNNVLISLGSGVINTRATLDYQISQGELRQLRVCLPANQRLLRVEGESVRTWDVLPGGDQLKGGPTPTHATKSAALLPGEQVLTVDLLKAVAPNYKLIVETEKALDTLPAQVRVEIPHALDVNRETGLVALRGSEELSLSAEAKELQRVDADEFARTTGEKKEGIVSAFRFLKAEFVLTARAETVQPQIEAVARNSVFIGSEQVNLHGQVDYTIKRAGVFALKLALPEGYRLQKVTGDKVLQWTEQAEKDARTLEITLKERTLGPYTLQLELLQTIKEAPKTMTIAGVYPLGTEKQTGFITISAELGIAVKTVSFDGLTEIPGAAIIDNVAQAANQPVFAQQITQQARVQQQQSPTSAPSPSGGTLAFKFIASAPVPPTAPWKLVIGTETVEPWVRAEVVHTFRIAEALISGRALVRYEIANAPVKGFRLRMPPDFKNVELAGTNIRRRDQDGQQWRIELQSKVRGVYLLTVTWEQVRSVKTNKLEIAGLEAVGVERETGALAIVARSPLQITETSAGDLLKLDVGELPEWAGRPDEATVLAYRYLRPGYKLGLDAKRFDEAEVLQALVDNARLTTVVADDGQMLTEMVLAIRNNGRQYLEVDLPASAAIWSTFVAGQPVRPSKRNGNLLLPLELSGADDAPVQVTLTFVSTNRFPRRRGPVDLVSPKLDVPLKNARWDLFMPLDYRYDDFGGSMTYESMGAGAAPVTIRYTLSEYTQQEQQKQDAQKQDVEANLYSAQQYFDKGKFKEAMLNLRQARSQKGGLDVAADRNLKQLEGDLNRAQSSNLILGQNAYFLQNFGQLDAQTQRPFDTQGISQQMAWLNVDAATAEQQWAKLQQAQEVAVAKVQPLHVNLPTRGLSYRFTQVLQTEIRKPMTIHFVATNTRAPSWAKRILIGLVGFLALWALVGLLLPRRNDFRTPPLVARSSGR
jgi:hypothetical protein